MSFYYIKGSADVLSALSKTFTGTSLKKDNSSYIFFLSDSQVKELKQQENSVSCFKYSSNEKVPHGFSPYSLFLNFNDSNVEEVNKLVYDVLNPLFNQRAFAKYPNVQFVNGRNSNVKVYFNFDRTFSSHTIFCLRKMLSRLYNGQYQVCNFSRLRTSQS